MCYVLLLSTKKKNSGRCVRADHGQDRRRAETVADPSCGNKEDTSQKCQKISRILARYKRVLLVCFLRPWHGTTSFSPTICFVP